MSKSKATVGQKIGFIRNKQQYLGIVEIVRENSVIVKISDDAAASLDYLTNRTVVNHNKYNVV